MLQLSIIAFAAIVLVLTLTILLKQTFKQRRLMRKRKPIDQDIRDRSQITWAHDQKQINHK